MAEEILTDFFDWTGRSTVIAVLYFFIKTNSEGICTTTPHSSFLTPHSKRKTNYEKSTPSKGLREVTGNI